MILPIDLLFFYSLSVLSYHSFTILLHPCQQLPILNRTVFLEEAIHP